MRVRLTALLGISVLLCACGASPTAPSARAARHAAYDGATPPPPPAAAPGPNMMGSGN